MDSAESYLGWDSLAAGEQVQERHMCDDTGCQMRYKLHPIIGAETWPLGPACKATLETGCGGHEFCIASYKTRFDSWRIPIMNASALQSEVSHTLDKPIQRFVLRGYFLMRNSVTGLNI